MPTMVLGTQVVELKLLKTPLIALPLVFLATMAISCTEEPVQPVVIQYDYSGELEFGGLVRTYDVHLPASYDGTSDFPLLLTEKSLSLFIPTVTGGAGQTDVGKTRRNLQVQMTSVLFQR